jgi:hypothetical protein
MDQSHSTEVSSKTCRTCGETKTLDQFHKQFRHGKWRIRVHCRTCVSAARRAKHAPFRKRWPHEPANEKRCTKCGIVKSLEFFYPQRHGLFGCTACCRACSYTREAELERRKDPEYLKERSLCYKRYKLQKLFGKHLSDEELLILQRDSLCSICGEKETAKHFNVKTKTLEPCSLSIDHDHKTGKIRGLLCRHCNHGIGNFMDDPALLMKAALYLEEHATTN